MGWWQWQNHGDSQPRKYDIKVVVYRNINMREIKKQYPVDPQKNKDYRYLKYDNALDYLNAHINENVMQQLTKELVNTRMKIINTMK